VTKQPVEIFQGEKFTVLPKIDQPELFDNVETELAAGGCVGIFPEGGSHDQTDLLPLKGGVCIMALGTMAKFGVPVTIQCVGLNYYEGYKFRSI
jgi:glycerol-3-phosphate O-acyltransferase/dihydroxyacetone phosphate acyltransferase